MGKFRNASDEALYVKMYCSKCVHYGNPEKGQDCPVMLVHWLYIDRRKRNPEFATILDSLIPIKSNRTKKTNEQCRMFHRSDDEAVYKEYEISHISQVGNQP